MAPEVVSAIQDYPDAAKARFREIREIILRAAKGNPAVGPITETLKWGQPSYLTAASKSGSTIRLAWSPKKPDYIAIYLNCQTTLTETVRSIYPDTFTFEGNRAVLMHLDAPVPTEAVEHCVKLAQTYHLTKRQR